MSAPQVPLTTLDLDKYDKLHWFFTDDKNDRRASLFAKLMLSGQLGRLKDQLGSNANQLTDFLNCMKAHHEAGLPGAKKALVDTSNPTQAQWKSDLDPLSRSFFKQYLDLQNGDLKVNQVALNRTLKDANLLTDWENADAKKCDPKNKIGLNRGDLLLFDLDVGNWVRSRLATAARKPIQSQEDIAVEGKEWSVLDMCTGEVIYRKLGSDKLFRMKDGQEQTLDIDAMSTNEANEIFRAANKCYSLGIDNTGDDCETLVRCILADEPEKMEECIEYLMFKQDFFKASKEQIQQIHPTLALRLLQRLGFRKYQVNDPVAGKVLWKVESVDHWLKHQVGKKFTKVDVDRLISNEKTGMLLKYLNMVSQFVNCNPAVLNKNYHGPSSESAGQVTVDDETRRLGIRAQIVPVQQDDLASLRSDVHRLAARRIERSAFINHLPFSLGTDGLMTSPMGTHGIQPYGVTWGFNMGLTGGDQSGGALSSPIGNKVSGAKLLRHYMNSLISSLARRNKTVSDDIKSKLNKNLDAMEEAETALLRHLIYLDEYSKMIDIFRDYSAVELNEQNLHKFLERTQYLNKKYTSIEDLLLDAIRQIQGAVAGESKYESLDLKSQL